jgi:hypothetical protein
MSEERSPWVVQKSNFLEVGNYVAEFRSVENKELNGEIKWKWTFEIKRGKAAGKDATALTNRSIMTGGGHLGHPGRLVQGLLGRPVVSDENVEAAIKACIGKTYLIKYEGGPKGGKPAVQDVGPVPEM